MWKPATGAAKGEPHTQFETESTCCREGQKHNQNAQRQNTPRSTNMCCANTRPRTQLNSTITAMGVSIREQADRASTPAGEGHGHSGKPETEHSVFSKLLHSRQSDSGQLAGDSTPKEENRLSIPPRLTFYVLQLPHAICLLYVVDGEALKGHLEVLHLREEQVVPRNGVFDRRVDRCHCLYSTGRRHTTPVCVS